MPQVASPTNHLRLKIISFILTSVAILAAVLIVGLFPTQKPAKVVTTEATVSIARDKSFGGDNDSAIILLQKQLKSATSTEDKVTLYVAIGTNYETKEDYPAALNAYQQAYKLMPTIGPALSVARAAEKSGDKALALTFYKRGQALIKSDQKSPHQNELPSIEESIIRVGGQL